MNHRAYPSSGFVDDGYGLDEFQDKFLEEFPHFHVLRWFDMHFRDGLGIDVFEHDFDAQRGHSAFSDGRFDVLVLKLERPDADKQAAIAEFLDYDDFELRRYNTSQDRDYAEKYARFKKSVDLPERYLDEMYESRYARHFYTEEEISEFRCRWS